MVQIRCLRGLKPKVPSLERTTTNRLLLFPDIWIDGGREVGPQQAVPMAEAIMLQDESGA